MTGPVDNPYDTHRLPDDKAESDPEDDYPYLSVCYLFDNERSLRAIAERLREEAAFLEARAGLGWEIEERVDTGVVSVRWTGEPDKRPKWYDETARLIMPWPHPS